MNTAKKQILIKLILFFLFISFSGLLNESIATDVEETVYVIQLRKNTNPKVIESAKKSLMAKYLDKTLLTQVQPPNYILSLGYFATEAEALEFKKGLEKDFPNCSVVPFEKKK